MTVTARTGLKTLIAAAGVCLIAASTAPAAVALPPGVSMADVQAALSGPISVPAGQTTTISLPVPVNAAYSGGGWNVSSGGASVTITAPAEGGTISVPVSAQGHSASITLVADPAQGGAAPGVGGQAPSNGSGGGNGEQPGDGNNGAGSNGGDGHTGSQDNAGSGGVDGSGAPGTGQSAEGSQNGASQPAGNQDALPAVPGTPAEQRKPASPSPTTGADIINVESTIEGNVITAQLGVTQALDLYNRFKDTDKAGVTLRYVDAQGNIIEGVKRDIDAANRTLTLTYPEGQAPDNPFIMQLVRKDGSGMDAIVTLRDPHYKSADAVDGQLPEGSAPTEGSSSSSSLMPFILGGVAVLAALLGIIIAVIRRKRSR